MNRTILIAASLVMAFGTLPGAARACSDGGGASVSVREAPRVRSVLVRSRHFDRVRGAGVDTYRVRFRGDRLAVVQARALDGSDLRVRVFDEDGDLVAEDGISADTPVAAWRSDLTQDYTILSIAVENSSHSRFNIPPLP